jgi:3-hexulose-6-phosphate synthase/6-phospho-3-hexuloisomerase
MGITIETIERPDTQMMTELGQFPTTILSDAMEKSQTMHSEVKPVYPIERICGPAVTARSIVADYLTPVAAIDYTQPGDVIVIDVKGYKDAAIWGDLAARSCQLRKVAAVIIDGAVRDSDGIRQTGVPHFSRAVTPNSGDCSVLGDINIPIQCAGVVVNPGDIIVADNDGVVVVPQQQAALILEKAKRQVEAEKELYDLMENEGLTCFQALSRVVGEITPTLGGDREIEIF